MTDWYDHNALFNRVADQQEVTPGSAPWVDAGIAAYSAQTGPHGAYGWRHDHKLSEGYARAACANYMHRGVFYDFAPFRKFGGTGAGRPEDWKAADHGRPQDLSNGAVGYFTEAGPVQVSGPDAQHAWFTPLYAVIGGRPFTLRVLDGRMASNAVAHITLTYHLRALFGQIRVPGTGDPASGRTPDIYDWDYADRGNMLLLAGMQKGLALGALEVTTADTAAKFLTGPFLRRYEVGPGLAEFGNSPPGEFRMGLYNSMFWLMGALQDCVLHDGFPEKPRLRAVLERLCQWALDLETEAPGLAFGSQAFTLPAGLQEPPATIKGMIQNIETGGDPGSVSLRRAWSYRACAIAAEFTKAPPLIAAEKSIRDEHMHNTESKAWMVGPNGEYVT